MQDFIVLASLVSELARGVKMTPLNSPQRCKKHLGPLRVKLESAQLLDTFSLDPEITISAKFESIKLLGTETILKV